MAKGNSWKTRNRTQAYYGYEARPILKRELKSKPQFTLDDLYSQFEQIKKMGSLKDVMGMLPGFSTAKIDDAELDDRIIDRQMAIITSMTKKERRNPSVLDASRRKRIAAGAGVQVSDVNKLMQQYEQSAKLMKQFAGGKMPRGMGKAMRGMGGMGSMGMGGFGGFPDMTPGSSLNRHKNKKKKKGRR